MSSTHWNVQITYWVLVVRCVSHISISARTNICTNGNLVFPLSYQITWISYFLFWVHVSETKSNFTVFVDVKDEKDRLFRYLHEWIGLFRCFIYRFLNKMMIFSFFSWLKVVAIVLLCNHPICPQIETNQLMNHEGDKLPDEKDRTFSRGWTHPIWIAL